MSFRCILFLLCTFSILRGIESHAQEDLETIFSDSGSPEIDQVIKWNAGGMVFADNSIFYEHFLSDFLSLEAGLGMTMNYNGWQFNNVFEEDRIPEGDSPNGGYSLNFSFKFYYFDKGPTGIYLAPNYMYRKREFRSQTIEHHYYLLNAGMQYGLSDRVFIDYHFGAGYRLSTTDKQLFGVLIDDEEENGGNFAASSSVKIGYAF